jgi:hypothetical protein
VTPKRRFFDERTYAHEVRNRPMAHTLQTEKEGKKIKENFLGITSKQLDVSFIHWF